MRIAVIGATGLVGSLLLPKIERHDVLVLSRRPSGRTEVEEKLASATDWPRLLEGETLDAAVSALGTTWRKAQSWPAFEAVDRTAVVAFSRAAKAAGARHMISVSAAGADSGSRNLYLALKGRMEQDLRAIGFDRLDLLRPGLLRGERGPDRRFGERIGILVSPVLNLLLRGPLDRFAAIDADRVAAAIESLLERSGTGVHVHHNREIRAFASRQGLGLARLRTSFGTRG